MVYVPVLNYWYIYWLVPVTWHSYILVTSQTKKQNIEIERRVNQPTFDSQSSLKDRPSKTPIQSLEIFKNTSILSGQFNPNPQQQTHDTSYVSCPPEGQVADNTKSVRNKPTQLYTSTRSSNKNGGETTSKPKHNKKTKQKEATAGCDRYE